MRPRIEQLLEELGNNRAELRAAVDAVPLALRGRRPAPDRWSVAENLEHLAIVETRIALLLTTRLAAAKTAGLGPEGDTSAQVTLFDPSRLVDRRARFKTGEASEPKGILDADAAWAALEEARSGVLQLLASADGFAVREITHPHPFFGPLNLYEWVAFLAGHDARHAAQIREAGDALTGRAE